MSSPIPPKGDFEKFPIHEMVAKLILGRFSGSVEIKSPGAMRIFHFDSGNLCAATSDHPEEKLDSILERTISPTLNREQKRLIKERIQGGQAYARALVDLGILHATELLAYNRNLAEVVLKGALLDVPESYRLSAGRPGQYNPVPFDPMKVLRESILDDLDGDTVARFLGDENTVFTPRETGRREQRLDGSDPELELILSHLDGRRSTGELAGRLGMNSDRTRRLLYFLKLTGVISPIEPHPGQTRTDEDASAWDVTGSLGAYGSHDTPLEDESADILKLLEREESAGAQAQLSEDGGYFKDSLQKKLGGAFKDKPTAKQKSQPGLFSGLQWSGAGRILIRYGLPLILGFLLVYNIVLMFTSGPEPDEGQRLSIYEEGFDASRLPLDEDFTARRPQNSLALKLPAQDLDDTDTSAQEQITSANTRESEAQPAADEADRVEADEASTTLEVHEGPTIERDDSSYEDVQSRALMMGHQGRWSEAADLWRPRIAADAADSYTLLIVRVERASFIQSVFEEFANNETLRNRFFIIRDDESARKYLICWGLFANQSSAKAEAASLPSRIRARKPSPAAIASLLK